MVKIEVLEECLNPSGHDGQPDKKASKMEQFDDGNKTANPKNKVNDEDSQDCFDLLQPPSQHHDEREIEDAKQRKLAIYIMDVMKVKTPAEESRQDVGSCGHKSEMDSETQSTFEGKITLQETSVEKTQSYNSTGSEKMNNPEENEISNADLKFYILIVSMLVHLLPACKETQDVSNLKTPQPPLSSLGPFKKQVIQAPTQSCLNTTRTSENQTAKQKKKRSKKRKSGKVKKRRNLNSMYLWLNALKVWAMRSLEAAYQACPLLLRTLFLLIVSLTLLPGGVQPKLADTGGHGLILDPSLPQKCTATFYEKRECPDFDREHEQLSQDCCGAAQGTVLHCVSNQSLTAACIPDTKIPAGFAIDIIFENGTPSIEQVPCEPGFYEPYERKSSKIRHPYCTKQKIRCNTSSEGRQLLCLGGPTRDDQCMCQPGFKAKEPFCNRAFTGVDACHCAQSDLSVPVIHWDGFNDPSKLCPKEQINITYAPKNLQESTSPPSHPPDDSTESRTPDKPNTESVTLSPVASAPDPKSNNDSHYLFFLILLVPMIAGIYTCVKKRNNTRHYYVNAKQNDDSEKGEPKIQTTTV